MTRVTVSRRGAARWRRGHPWIFRSDVTDEPQPAEPGVVEVLDASGRPLGPALYSPASEIRVRMLDRGTVAIDTAWWRERVLEAAGRRIGIEGTAFRLVHGEADGLPSLIVDRYGSVLSVQLLSAGLERCRTDVIRALEEALEPSGILLRNDAPVRKREGLDQAIEVASGDVPDRIEVESDGLRRIVDLRAGQKTGGFLDQRENRWLAGQVASGRGLDLFCYEGGFALQMADGCDEVVAVDKSRRALARVSENAELNGVENVTTVEGNAFDVLRGFDDDRVRFGTIVVDPPAFAKHRKALRRALSGYKDLNLRAMRALTPGGHLLTFSCSFHVSRPDFEDMLRAAAADSGRRIGVVAWLGAGRDHPSLLTVPETAYLKGALLTAW